MRKRAIISVDGQYRYRLSRHWDDGAPSLTFIMLNPSTADAEVDDPTIRRCIGFAKRQSFGGIYVANLYAFRATEPRDMKRAIDPIGPENNQILRYMFSRAADQLTPVVAAWGTHADPRRVRDVMKLNVGATVLSLGVTKDGHPRHPLYVRADQELTPWPPSKEESNS